MDNETKKSCVRMKILFTSDLHGDIDAYKKFVFLLKNYDLGIIAGDLLHNKSKRAFLNIKSLLSLSNKPVLIIPGNHDLIKWKNYKNIYNIHYRSVKYGNYNFVGYRYTTLERSDENQEKDFQKLKSYINRNTILVTHSPAYGILDDYCPIHHVGSKVLLNIIKEKNPKLHLHGHSHLDFGIQKNSINGSYPIDRKFVSIKI